MAQDLGRFAIKINDTYTAGSSVDAVFYTNTGKIIIQNFVITNNCVTDKVIDINFEVYDSINSVYVQYLIMKGFTIPAGDTLSVSELYNQVLIGDATNPDKITISISEAPATGESVDIVGSYLVVS